MVNVKQAAQSIAKLSILRFFPSDPNAQAGIVQIACEMAKSNAQIDWLVERMLKIYNEWPGPREMRACFCNRYPPADGVSACSEIYPDGGFPIDPTAPPRAGIAAPERLALPEGHKITADPELEKAIGIVAEKCAMPAARERTDRFSRTLREVLTGPQDRPLRPASEPISPERRAEIQAEIDRVLAERKRA